jgi:predicted enzyme related to lactoylglutathione lyase
LRFEMLRRPATPSGRIIFIEYDGREGATPEVGPPARGLHALRYDCDDIERFAGRVGRAGGAIERGPIEVDSPVLGRGRVLSVRPPFGTLVEIWQPRA